MHSQPRLGTTCRLVAFAGSVLAGAQACSGTLSSNAGGGGATRTSTPRFASIEFDQRHEPRRTQRYCSIRLLNESEIVEHVVR